MRSHPRVLLLALLTVALVGGLISPAHAARPSWAGPPEVETMPVVESDPPSFLCDGRLVTFSSGDVTFRFKELPNDGSIFKIQLHNAEATDGEITYRARGGAQGQWTGGEEEGSGRWQTNITFVGPDGEVERVQSTYTYRHGEETVTERGTCSEVYPE